MKEAQILIEHWRREYNHLETTQLTRWTSTGTGNDRLARVLTCRLRTADIHT